MTDPRPKPQYGEYAPPGWVSPVQQPVPATESTRVDRAGRSGAVGSAAIRRPRARAWDVPVTFGLLMLWAVVAIEGLFSFPRLAETLGILYTQMEIGEFTLVDQARSAGIALAVIQVVLLALTIWRSYRSLKRGKLAFYWPLIGFVVYFAVLLVVLAVLIFSDPAYLAHIKTLGG